MSQQNRTKYGLSFPYTWTNLDIELYAFRVGRSEDQGGLGQHEHFWNVTQYLWGVKNVVRNTTKYFIRNPWSEDMIYEACRQKYIGVGGASGGTKSETYAMWLLVNYLSNARHFLGIILSTSLKEARRRIWGSLADFIHAVPHNLLPLRVLDSLGLVRYESPTFTAGPRSAIALVAAERKQEKEAVGKLIGMHQDFVCVVADELSELGESILEYALPGGNLSANPRHQFIGLSNPLSYFDSFGKFWKPKLGWTSISAADEKWESQYGVSIHLDGLKSPNILEPSAPYRTPNGLPFLPTAERIEEAKMAEGGENSLRFWRMVRGFMAPMGEEECIYSNADIIKFRGDEPAIWGDEPLTRVAAVDAGYTNGGDRTVIYFGTFGKDKLGMKVLQFDRHYYLYEDVTNTKEDRSFQIARQIKDMCDKEGVSPQHCALDSTGAGSPFCDVVATVWSRDILRVNFGGGASELSVSLSDTTPAKERYHNRVTEIWYSGKELLRQGQLKGISPACASEMIIRHYSLTGIGKKIVVETKEDMKLRTGGRSPDIADAAFIMVTLCRERLGLSINPNPEPIVGPARPPRTWRQIRLSKGAKLALPMNLTPRADNARNPET